MRTRFSSNLIVESFAILKRRNRRRSKQIVEPELQTIVETPVATMADTCTMSELLQVPTEGYGDAIVLPAILAEIFELKVMLLTLVTSSQFHGFERDDPHSHILWSNKITSTLKYKNVPREAIKLMLFPFSLEGAAQIWLEKEPPLSIYAWENLVSMFVNYFFPFSKTTNLKNDIMNFQQRFEETFSEAWDCFKDLLCKCPHHDFSELHQIDTFYNALTQSDQDSLNAAADGNLLNRTPQDALTIIENKSKVHTSRNKLVVSKASAATSSSTPAYLPEITDLTDAVKAMILQNKNPSPASVKAMEEICVTCGCPHPYYECLATDGNTFNRLFLRTARALIDVHGEELTLRVNDEAITFNVGHTSRYSYRYNYTSVNRIDVIDITCEEYAQEVLRYSGSSKSSNSTPSLNPIIVTSSPSLTPLEGGDFILEEIEACLTKDLILSGIDDADFDLEGDILLLDKLLNDDLLSPLPPKELHFEELKIIKSSIDDPLELELKDLPYHLEYAFLEETYKLPVIIAKNLKDEEKACLFQVLKSYKRAIAWKISDIKGIDPQFCTHKILMEDDFKPAVKHQRRVNLKIHEVIKKEVIKCCPAAF
nr:reverse transcriptase domain-containing protein [Tanacetum cinerariifolium]